MKSLFYNIILCTFCLSAVSTYGQLDLAITEIVDPAPGTTFNSNETIAARFVISNEGTTTIAAGDTIFFTVEVNGSIANFNGVNVMTVRLNEDFAPGSSIAPTFSAAYNFTGFGIQGEFTYGFQVRGIVCCPPVDDANPENDLLTITLRADDNSVGIEEDKLANISSYFDGKALHIEGEGLSNQPLNIEVYDLSGLKVKTINTGTHIRDFKQTHSLDDLAPGIYIFRLSQGNDVLESKKIIKL